MKELVLYQTLSSHVASQQKTDDKYLKPLSLLTYSEESIGWRYLRHKDLFHLYHQRDNEQSPLPRHHSKDQMPSAKI